MARRAAASLLALDRLFAADQEDGSLDLILMARAPLELAVAAKALAHWLTTGLPLVVAAPLLGLLLNLDPPGQRRGGADAAGRHAGADLHRPDRRGADGGVAARRAAAAGAGAAADRSGADLRRAASNAAIVGPVPFGTPFTILCALTLISLVVGPFAAAAALRHGLE